MIILMGLAGSGKGTQGELLSKNLRYEYFSTGEFLRNYISGKRKAEMLAGKLVDDAEMIKIISRYLDSLSDRDSCILDGFPRSEAQAKWLLDLHRNKKINIETLIYIDVPEDELMNRLLTRGRVDDNEQAIKTRFAEYKKSTFPILEMYQQHSIKILHINGTGPVGDIQQNILSALDKL